MASSADSPPYEGYNLFSPMNSTNAYLIDNNGNMINTWHSGYFPGMSVYLLENGRLLRAARMDNNSFGTGGAAGRVELFDWDSHLLWAYEYNTSDHLQHHDIEMLPNSNVLMIAWERKTAAEALAAGRDPSLLDSEVWPDHVIEVAPTGTFGGTIVWE